jgi:hypothetical protein
MFKGYETPDKTEARPISFQFKFFAALAQEKFDYKFVMLL